MKHPCGPSATQHRSDVLRMRNIARNGKHVATAAATAHLRTKRTSRTGGGAQRIQLRAGNRQRLQQLMIDIQRRTQARQITNFQCQARFMHADGNRVKDALKVSRSAFPRPTYFADRHMRRRRAPGIGNDDRQRSNLHATHPLRRAAAHKVHRLLPGDRRIVDSARRAVMQLFDFIGERANFIRRKFIAGPCAKRARHCN